MFLTATPHNGYPESFTALLELLDGQRFARGVRPDREQLAAVMVRRLKSEIPARWDGSPRFATRRVLPLEVAYTDAEKQAHALLQAYTRSRLDHAQNEAETTQKATLLVSGRVRVHARPARTLSGKRPARGQRRAPAGHRDFAAADRAD